MRVNNPFLFPVFTDQSGRNVIIDTPPRRIISLVPSQTELLHYFGLNEEVVGITKFCVHPQAWFRTKTRVGGTKDIKHEIIHSLQPGLIIANKEENIREQVEELSKHYPVWVSDVNNLADAYEMVEQVGTITAKKETAQKLVTEIKQAFSMLKNDSRRITACYLIWQKPYMTVGGDTFINAMMEAAGFENVFKSSNRYPEITLEDIRAKNPAIILLSSEPFPFTNKHTDELKPHFPGTAIITVNGELFSWYGSRMLHAPAYFLNLRQHGFH